MPPRDRKRYDAVKRVLDVSFSAVGLVVTAPLQLMTAGAVLAGLGRPVLFRQRRPGLDGEIFELVKFRTMRAPDPSRRTDAARLTGLGRFLRSSSLDELPTLCNVLVGQMSFIGPRPLLPQYLSLYTKQQARRHEVRPGITGLAQVSGRNLLTWEERFALDVQYVDQRSLALDASIFRRTVHVVLRRVGISAEGHATVEPFAGASDLQKHHG